MTAGSLDCARCWALKHDQARPSAAQAASRSRLMLLTASCCTLTPHPADDPSTRHRRVTRSGSTPTLPLVCSILRPARIVVDTVLCTLRDTSINGRLRRGISADARLRGQFAIPRADQRVRWAISHPDGETIPPRLRVLAIAPFPTKSPSNRRRYAR